MRPRTEHKSHHGALVGQRSRREGTWILCKSFGLHILVACVSAVPCLQCTMRLLLLSFVRSFILSFFLHACCATFPFCLQFDIISRLLFDSIRTASPLSLSLSSSSSSCSSSSAPFQGRHSSIARGCSHSKALHLRFAAEDHFHFSIWVSATKRSTVIMGIILGCLVQVSDFDELLTFRFSCTITSASNINKAVRNVLILRKKLLKFVANRKVTECL